MFAVAILGWMCGVRHFLIEANLQMLVVSTCLFFLVVHGRSWHLFYIEKKNQTL